MPRRNTLADSLQALRVSRDLSQFDLAVKSTVPLNTIQRIEQGVTTDPKASTAIKLAKALGVTIGQLLGTERVTRKR
jgi:transcriptional regulator with XRE-family HTH domain